VRRIGLLGGMSWESSAEYYRLLNVLVRERLGGLASAECLLYSDDLVVLCTNTMHKVADTVAEALTVPLLHLGDTTAYAVRRAGLSTVGLLGTAFTMEQVFYRDRLASHDLTVLVPDADDRALVHRVIYEELCLGVVRPESRAAYVAVIDRLAAAGAEGVVLGCTEIELLIDQDDVDLPVFPTTRLHVEAALDAALAR